MSSPGTDFTTNSKPCCGNAPTCGSDCLNVIRIYANDTRMPTTTDNRAALRMLCHGSPFPPTLNPSKGVAMTERFGGDTPLPRAVQFALGLLSDDPNGVPPDIIAALIWRVLRG